MDTAVDRPWFFAWEHWLADKIYASYPNLLTSHRKPRNGALTAEQLRENEIIDFVYVPAFSNLLSFELRSYFGLEPLEPNAGAPESSRCLQ
jgi:hypothetical protein